MNTPATPTADEPTPAVTAVAASECMRADELAVYLRVNRKTVYEYAARNVIPCRRLGRRLVFSRAAVVAWLARQALPSLPPSLGIVR